MSLLLGENEEAKRNKMLIMRNYAATVTATAAARSVATTPAAAPRTQSLEK